MIHHILIVSTGIHRYKYLNIHIYILSTSYTNQPTRYHFHGSTEFLRSMPALSGDSWPQSVSIIFAINLSVAQWKATMGLANPFWVQFNMWRYRYYTYRYTRFYYACMYTKTCGRHVCSYARVHVWASAKTVTLLPLAVLLQIITFDGFLRTPCYQICF